MKRILYILILLTGIVHAQETIPESQKYRTHSIAISQRFGGSLSYQTMVDIATAEGFTVKNNFGFFMSSFEFFTERRKGRSKYTPMIAIRLSYAQNNPFALGGFHGGFLLGGSQYLFDLRNKQTGIGWSMMANGGLTIDLPTIDKIKASYFPVILGGEIDFKTIYNTSKNFGITFGFNIGYAMSMGLLGEVFEDDTVIIGPGFPPTSVLFDHNFTWAFNIGVIF